MEEAVDITEKWFIDLCRFATQGADVEARLSPSVFAVYWTGIAAQRDVDDVLARWLPMEVRTPTATVPMDAGWGFFEVSPGQSSRDVFDRVVAEIGEDALPRGWDGQVG